MGMEYGNKIPDIEGLNPEIRDYGTNDSAKNVSVTVGSPTGIDDTENVEKALSKLESGSNTLKFGAGTYKIRNVSILNKNLKIIGDGIDSTILLALEDAPILSYESEYTDETAVSNITPTTDTESITTLIECATSGYFSGDIIKLYSEDIELLSADSGGYGSARNGEYFTVSEIVPSGIIVYGEPRETFTTDIKVSKVGNNTVQISDLSIGNSDGNTQTKLQSLVDIVGGKWHKVQTKLYGKHEQTCIRFTGCYGYDVNLINQYQLDDTGSDILGYGVVDKCSFGFNVEVNSVNVRHPFTCNAGDVNNASPAFYGVSQNGTVKASGNGKAVAFLDDHPLSYNLIYRDSNINSFYQYGALSRGRKNSYVNLIIEAPYPVGVRDWATIPCDTVFKNCIFTTKILYNVLTSSGILNVNSKILFEDCVFDGVSSGDYRFAGCKNIKFKNCNFANTSLRFEDCNTVFDGCTLSPKVGNNTMVGLYGGNHYFMGTNINYIGNTTSFSTYSFASIGSDDTYVSVVDGSAIIPNKKNFIWASLPSTVLANCEITAANLNVVPNSKSQYPTTDDLEKISNKTTVAQPNVVYYVNSVG